MNKHLAPVALSVGLLGIVGGVAAAHAFQPVAKPAQVRLVQPAAVVVTPSPTTTTPVVRITPKPAPVQSVKRVATAAPVQKAAAVMTDPTPAPAQTASTASPAQDVPAPAMKGNPVGTVTYDPYASAPEPKKP
jgi:hypothetical protein